MNSLAIRCVILGIFLSGAVAVSAIAFPLSTARVDQDHGLKLFSTHCKQCHGNSSEDGEKLGPSLLRIGSQAASRVEGQTAAGYLWESILYPDKHTAGEGKMPAIFGSILSEKDLHDLVGYLGSLGGKPDYREILSFRKPEMGVSEATAGRSVALEDVKEGRRLFYQKFECSKCHFVGEPYPGSDFLAPSLAAVGLFPREYLIQSIRNPSQEIHKSYRTAQVLTSDGQLVTGRILKKNDQGVTLLSTDSQGYLIPSKFQLEELEEVSPGEKIRYSPVSSMAPWSVEQMTDEELEKILSFLSVLRG